MKINSVALILGILILACLMITPAMAETLNGSIGTGAWNSTNYQTVTGGSYYTVKNYFDRFVVYEAYKISEPKSAVYWWGTTSGQPSNIPSFDAGAPSGAQTSVVFRLTDTTNDATFKTVNTTGPIIGTGSISYQRVFNSANPPVEQYYGYVSVTFNTWNASMNPTSELSYIYLDYNPALLYNMSQLSIASPGMSPGPVGTMTFYSAWIVGYTPVGFNTFNKGASAYGWYDVSKPAGLGIQGYVNKTNGKDGQWLYPSQAFITKADGTTITSDSQVNVNPLFFNIPESPTTNQIKICLYSNEGVWYNSSVLFTNTTITSPTPTPTPIAGAVYTITTSTDYVNVSGTNTVTIASLTDPTLADLKFISFGYSDSTNVDTPLNEVGSTIHKSVFSLIGGQWTGYNSQSVEYDNVVGAVPSPHTNKWDTTSGDKTLVVTLQNTAGDYTYLTRTIHVGQGVQNLIETKVQAVDGTNGGTLGMVSMQIYNHNTATWTNLSPNDGLGKIITPVNTILSFYVQKIGFTNGTLMTQPARADLTYQVPLFIGPTVGAGFVNYFVTVQDSNGYPLGGASIAITPAAGATKIATSSTNGGSQIFNLTASTLHTYSITKIGYQGQSGSFTTGTTAGSLTVKLLPLVTPTKTYVIPTGSWTVSPTYGVSNTTFWEPWKRVFGMMGANSTELPILIAGLVIILCMAAGAGMAGVLGAEVAMGFGAILCVALGLIHIWVVLAIIILGFLFYGLKIGR